MPVRLPSVGVVSSHRSLSTSAPPRAVVRRVWELGTPGLRALAAFAVLVAVLAGVLAWRARPQVQPVPPAVSSSVSSSASASTATGGTLVVAVSGKVHRPGLVRLPAGSRVADAIDAAGGALPGTDLSLLNLARKVTDGELILVGIAPPPGSAVAAGASAGGLVNLNTASLEQLQTLPGVGPVLAQRIVDYRDQHGGFKTVADLQKVSGIGDTRYNDLKNRVTV
jgi:competence protein ComEA